MKDLVTKGTGNSRYLKTSLASGTTWASALAQLRAGTFPVDFNGLNTAGIDQQGSAYSKANVLPDDVCEQLGLDSTTAEPKDAFLAVRNPAETFVWEKCTQVAETVTKGDLIENFALSMAEYSGYGIVWNYADDITVDSAGNVSLSGTVTTLTVSSGVAISTINVLKGKYAYPNAGTIETNRAWCDFYCMSEDGTKSVSKIVYFPEDTTSVAASTSAYNYGGTARSASYTRIMPAQPVFGHPAHLETVEYVASKDFAEYPDGGWSGGYYYKLIQNGVQTFYSSPLYLWKKRSVSQFLEELYNTTQIFIYGPSGRIWFTYGDEVEFVDGRATIKSPTEVSFSGIGANNLSQLDVLKGKYIQYIRGGNSAVYLDLQTQSSRYAGNSVDVFYISQDATFSMYASSYVSVVGATVVRQSIGGATNYLCSFDYNHYPHNTVEDEYYYEYMGELSELLHNNDELVNIILGVTST